ncbi:UNVERIFIED_CONTAM: hypothetical protein FKN15_073201 [Acipenser sinensis]
MRGWKADRLVVSLRLLPLAAPREQQGRTEQCAHATAQPVRCPAGKQLPTAYPAVQSPLIYETAPSEEDAAIPLRDYSGESGPGGINVDRSMELRDTVFCSVRLEKDAQNFTEATVCKCPLCTLWS